jgi:carbon storage regulator
MLVLSRKVGEGVWIGDGIVVHVVAVRGGRVRLGITAPADAPIHREELRRRAAPAPGQAARRRPGRREVRPDEP